MMWIPLRSAKMYGFIFGFQRRVWWPKWTPASSSWRIEIVGTGKDLLFGSTSADLPCREPDRDPAPPRRERSRVWAPLLRVGIARLFGPRRSLAQGACHAQRGMNRGRGRVRVQSPASDRHFGGLSLADAQSPSRSGFSPPGAVHVPDPCVEARPTEPSRAPDARFPDVP